MLHWEEKKMRKRELTINIDEHEYSWCDTKTLKLILYIYFKKKNIKKEEQCQIYLLTTIPIVIPKNE